MENRERVKDLPEKFRQAEGQLDLFTDSELEKEAKEERQRNRAFLLGVAVIAAFGVALWALPALSAETKLTITIMWWLT
jgi:hypothetical protein